MTGIMSRKSNEAYDDEERTDSVESREEVRARRLYIDYLAAAGIAKGRLSVESLFMLPIEFVRAYSLVFDAALRESVGDGKSQGNRELGELGKASVSSIYKGKRVGAGAGGKGSGRYRDHWVIRNEEMLALKGRIDRRLLGLVDEVRVEIAGAKNGGHKCTGGRENKRCGRFVKETWKYCPECGSEIIR